MLYARTRNLYGDMTIDHKHKEQIYNPIILSALYFWRLQRSLHFKAHINDNANRTQVIQQHKFKVKVDLENIPWKTHQKWGLATVNEKAI